MVLGKIWYSNPEYEINSLVIVNENVVIINYHEKEECYEPLQTVNVVIAAYVTTQARLKLYSFLERLEERVLYYDTDSVIYISKAALYEPSTGNFIGDMTDELEGYGPGSYIKEFVSGGPKNYAYKLFSSSTNEEECVCKVKGIKLSFKASNLINFESMRQMIMAGSSAEPITIFSKYIIRTKEHDVVTKTESKIYNVKSTKRKFFEDGCSLPYGYRKLKN